MILFLFFFLGCLVLRNFQRTSFWKNSELTPNVLLTKHPLVFIPGEKSLFYFRNYWNQAPSFLAEHGFEVYQLHLPWRGEARKEKIRNWLMQNNKVHIFCDLKTQEWLQGLQFEYKSHIASIQILENTKISNSNSSSISLKEHLDYRLDQTSLKIHNILCQQNLKLEGLGYKVCPQLLSQVRFLAEKDFSS